VSFGFRESRKRAAMRWCVVLDGSLTFFEYEPGLSYGFSCFYCFGMKSYFPY
jgi:hypothetical protein